MGLDSTRSVDVLCIGAGPSNLSVGALLRENSQLSCEILERSSETGWHPGLLWTSSRLQGNPLNDLVTPVSPTNRLSFLCFLKEHGRLSRHIIASRWNGVSRVEFSDYLTWVARSLNVRRGQNVVSVSAGGETFAVVAESGEVWRSRDLVVGVGAEPRLPACVAGLGPERVWHAGRHTQACTSLRGKRVAVIGGGQSAGELVLRLLSTPDERPAHLVWITGQGGLRAMDTSPFGQEYFYSGYASDFRRLGNAERKREVSRQLLTIQGISEEVLGRVHSGAGLTCGFAGDPVWVGSRVREMIFVWSRLGCVVGRMTSWLLWLRVWSPGLRLWRRRTLVCVRRTPR